MAHLSFGPGKIKKDREIETIREKERQRETKIDPNKDMERQRETKMNREGK